MSADKLDPLTRAEDILLGALGYDVSASIIEVHPTENGYAGSGKYVDGEVFEFESGAGLAELESWAIKVITQGGSSRHRSADGGVMTLGGSARLRGKKRPKR